MSLVRKWDSQVSTRIRNGHFFLFFFLAVFSHHFFSSRQPLFLIFLGFSFSHVIAFPVERI